MCGLPELCLYSPAAVSLLRTAVRCKWLRIISNGLMSQKIYQGEGNIHTALQHDMLHSIYNHSKPLYFTILLLCMNSLLKFSYIPSYFRLVPQKSDNTVTLRNEQNIAVCLIIQTSQTQQHCLNQWHEFGAWLVVFLTNGRWRCVLLFSLMKLQTLDLKGSSDAQVDMIR